MKNSLDPDQLADDLDIQIDLFKRGYRIFKQSYTQFTYSRSNTRIE